MICKECGRECDNFRSLGVHLYYSHKNITLEEYYKKYLSKSADEGRCKLCNEKCNFISLSLGYHTYCCPECQRKSPETLAKSRTTRKKHFGDKYRSEEGTRRMAMANKNNAAVRAKKLKDTYFQKTGFLHPSQNPVVEAAKNRKYTFDENNFDSSWELAYYIWLRDNKFSFKFHHIKPLVYEYENKKHKYYPDFEVNGQLVEIKSPVLLERMLKPNCADNAKYRCMVEHGVKIMTDCSEYLNYIEEKYGKDYMQQFRNK